MAKKNVGGRPRKLAPDVATMKQLRGLARIQATTKECAAAMGVSEPTFLKFRDDHPEVAQAMDEGRGLGQISLRRKQIAVAMEGNPTMLIWTGKQYLAQSDKAELNGTVTLEALILASMKLEKPASAEPSAAIESPPARSEISG